jgi:chemotaxis protein MotB
LSGLPRRTNQNQWYITYSDLVTLLLCFFVLLYSFSTLDVQRFQSVIRAFQSIFGSGIMEGNNGVMDDALEGIQMENTDYSTTLYGLLRRDWEQLEEIREQLTQMLQVRGWESFVSVHREEWGLVLRFKDSVLFELGKADLTPEALNILAEISIFLSRWPNHVRIEGHTDNLPIRNERFPSNWELSTARATTVLRFLLAEADFDPLKISAVGYGEYRPVAPNETPEERQKNRRVDIVILRQSLWEMNDFDIDQLFMGEATEGGGDE